VATRSARYKALSKQLLHHVECLPILVNIEPILLRSGPGHSSDNPSGTSAGRRLYGNMLP
jgi:hypothetical protein